MADLEPVHECDAFRRLENVFVLDPRQACYVVLDPTTGPRTMTLADHWRDIATMALHEGVPRVIRVHFETARNLLLYSWFAYRFHQVAEMHAYASVEYALRIRGGYRSGQRSPTLKWLLERAVKEGWIRDDGFRQYRRIAEQRAESEREEAIGAGTEPDSATDREIQSYVKILGENLPHFRNKLAHGSARLTPSGKRTLALCSDLINQLFQNPSMDRSTKDPWIEPHEQEHGTR